MTTRRGQSRVFEVHIIGLTMLCLRFMSDNEAWSELCELYIQEQDMSKAAFCMEELIMSNPRSHLYHQKYAEVSQLDLSSSRSKFHTCGLIIFLILKAEQLAFVINISMIKNSNIIRQ